MRKILLLGASGSIGQQTIEIIEQFKNEFELVSVSVGKNIEQLENILSKFKLETVYSIDRVKHLENKYPHTTFYYGDDLDKFIYETDYSTMINALVGFVGLKPTLIAIETNKQVLLANKESLVAGGEIVKEKLKTSTSEIIPIDSEHSAIFQCLQGRDPSDINKLYITASGGSFRDLAREELNNVDVKKALNHPNWSMGKKITIDSATMMNKLFEVIEAHYLFNIDYSKIEAILHKQSIIHSLIEFKDGSIINQMGLPDMKLPIKYALFYPRHIYDKTQEYLNLNNLNLTFEPLNLDRYVLFSKCLKYGIMKKNMGAALVSINDTCVNLFLDEKISYLQMEDLILNCLKQVKIIENCTYDDLKFTYDSCKKLVMDLYKEIR